MSRHEFTLEMQGALTQVGWHGMLNEAVTQEDVVAIARDYLAQWSPQEISRLPAVLRPGKIVDADDIACYAVALVQEQVAAEQVPAVHKMATFFSNASLRLSQILARSSEVSAERRESVPGYGE